MMAFERLPPYAFRYERSREQPDRPPWLFEPPLVHVGELVFSPPLASEDLADAARSLLPSTGYAVWAFDGERWSSVSGGTVATSIERLAFSSVLMDSIESPEREREAREEARVEAEYLEREGLAPPPPLLPSIEVCLERWAATLDRPSTSRVLGSDAALKAELERVKTFFTLESRPHDVPTLALIVGIDTSTNDSPTEAQITDAMTTMGWQPVDGGFRYELPSGCYEDTLVACLRAADELRFILSVSIDLMGAHEAADILFATVEQLVREWGVSVRSELTDDSDVSVLKSKTRETLAYLEAHGYFAVARRFPSVDLRALDALVDERMVLGRGKLELRAAGRRIVVPIRATRSAFFVCLALAAALALGMLVEPFIGLIALVFCFFAWKSAPKPELEAELDMRTLTLRGRGIEAKYVLPFKGLHAWQRREPITDADGHAVALPTARGYDPESVRLLDDALFVRNALAGARWNVSMAARVVLEAIAASPIDWRGRPEGYVAVAVDATGALACFADRESHEAWAPASPPHRLGFVYAEDESGKGASVGYPSAVEWDLDPAERLSRIHCVDE